MNQSKSKHDLKKKVTELFILSLRQELNFKNGQDQRVSYLTCIELEGRAL